MGNKAGVETAKAVIFHAETAEYNGGDGRIAGPKLTHEIQSAAIGKTQIADYNIKGLWSGTASAQSRCHAVGRGYIVADVA